MSTKRFDENVKLDREYIYSLIENAKNTTTDEEIDRILEKAKNKKGLDHSEIASLLEIENEDQIKKLFKVAGEIKKNVYGNRVVLFAPLYISDYCVNNCVYCGYKCKNKFQRRRLTMDEIRQEVEVLEQMGHKRLALEAGEDPLNCPIEYVLESIKTIYDTYNKNGVIRRINVNIAATTVENYKKLKDAEIGTYILFQESYDEEVYKKMHPNCVKGNYEYHTTSFDRAMEAGIDDVGAGVLFGLADPKFEVLGLMMHNEHLEKKFGVGFHTISVPRLRAAEGVSLETFPNLVSDDMFKKIVAIIRLAVPYTGMILSTREDEDMRKELLEYGISQVSAGSCPGVGGYVASAGNEKTDQFETADERTPIEVISDLMDNNYIPSYCTACYRAGRTGEKFMNIAKSEKIHHMCKPNALTTLMEYAADYGDEEFLKKAEKFVREQAETIDREDIRNFALGNIEKIKNGERDLYI
ncbi:[FeFe] hydrogenase H-cluster radical SAM maturase HydG [Peptostreptococcus faecalis]|uniref:[FeFe] hydrogenase H-cluster radical SAM maturase HydG n=1 Tax=Peptostreptococcus faecalis TaxID=2045015 RepID=UPI000C7B048D|nr:[FeFe] hydrogenase H-cluster radical SAM maturase HydG [Peptostreptococcus faecalis]